MYLSIRCGLRSNATKISRAPIFRGVRTKSTLWELLPESLYFSPLFPLLSLNPPISPFDFLHFLRVLLCPHLISSSSPRIPLFLPLISPMVSLNCHLLLQFFSTSPSIVIDFLNFPLLLPQLKSIFPPIPSMSPPIYPLFPLLFHPPNSRGDNLFELGVYFCFSFDGDGFIHYLLFKSNFSRRIWLIISCLFSFVVPLYYEACFWINYFNSC